MSCGKYSLWVMKLDIQLKKFLSKVLKKKLSSFWLASTQLSSSKAPSTFLGIHYSSTLLLSTQICMTQGFQRNRINRKYIDRWIFFLRNWLTHYGSWEVPRSAGWRPRRADGETSSLSLKSVKTNVLAQRQSGRKSEFFLTYSYWRKQSVLLNLLNQMLILSRNPLGDIMFNQISGHP